ncbi:uncharacterized protein LOC143863747 [Tasmannia lanceolata]|uniref:uncharacterized protein LOC143863747 n=1 Tax=Tasmannia lanceolata TaxID=3420 RepID=UPI0040635415
MLGLQCARPKPCVGSPVSLAYRLPPSRRTSLTGAGEGDGRIRKLRQQHCCCHRGSSTCPGGAASIWHVTLPSGSCEGEIRRNVLLKAVAMKEEGSWNAAWDVRPARWLHGSDSAWLLFGVCGCFEPLEGNSEVDGEEEEEEEGGESGGTERRAAQDYRITGVLADGRCMFRALAHGDCLRSGAEAPDETRQRELADDLRAQVANELLKRRDEIEWFIEGDFDTYVKSIQQPSTWGGEPELLMASHVLQTQISVFMIDRSSGGLVTIASYGQGYGKDKNGPIKVLFHGYGHYDLLEIFSG